MPENKNILYQNLDSLSNPVNNPINTLNNKQVLEESNDLQNIQPKNSKTSSFFKGFIVGILVIIGLSIVIWFFTKEQIINNYIDSGSKLDCSITYDQEINQQGGIIFDDKKDTIEGDKKDIKDTMKNNGINIEDSSEEDSEINYNVTFTATPKVTFWGKKIKFTTNNSDKKIKKYHRKFDEYTRLDSQFASDSEYAYSHGGIYDVTLTVEYEDNSYSEYQDEIFIGEPDSPIAAFTVKNNGGDKLTRIKKCRVLNNEGYEDIQNAYSIKKDQKIIIDPSISINTNGISKGLQYVFEDESIDGNYQKVKVVNQLEKSFSETGCHYVDLTVKDTNVGKQDKVRIWFDVE